VRGIKSLIPCAITDCVKEGMEAFAQAIVCKHFGVRFVAVKYVTGIIGRNSVKHWEDKLGEACEGLGNWFGQNLHSL